MDKESVSPQTARIVTGGWRVIFMIGCPVGQTRAPFLFNTHFASRASDIVMVPLEIQPDGLAGFIESVRGASNCIGVVITLPHKGAVCALADVRSERALALKSVNIVRRAVDGTLFGDMLDGPGFWNGVEEKGFSPHGSGLVLAGAGAAGRAIAHEFVARGGRRLSVLSQFDEDFATLATMLAKHDIELKRGLPDSLADWDIVVNATPVGMAHTPGSLFPRDFLSTMSSHGVVADAITAPLATQLLTEAATLGLATVNGNAMTAGQFPLMLDFLLGAANPY